MQKTLQKIKQADDEEIQHIIRAVMQRYRTHFPDCEVMFTSAPVSTPVLRRQFHDDILAVLRMYNNFPSSS